jgi:DNA-binding response OmpR family regulator
MPEQDGIGTLLAIRRQASTAKVIVMSGHHSRLDYLRMAKQLGASDALRKPFSPEDLAAAIYRCLGPTAVAAGVGR